MSTTTREPMAAAWADHAEALADWALARLVVRRDVYGAYNRDGGQYTAHEALTRDLLIAHFSGVRVIGVHTTAPDGLCLAVGFDIDAHDAGADPAANWARALMVAGLLKALGLTPLIIDSNGKGGYHVRVFFRKPIPVAVARRLGERIMARVAEDGRGPIEAFPKQGELTLARPYGNWLRLPGRHHKRGHWSRIYDPERDAWLEGEAAVRRLLKVAGDDPKAVLDAYRAERAADDGAAPAGPPAANGRHRGRGEKAEESVVREALDHLPADWRESYGGTRADTGWLGTGMALHDWDPARGLALWHDFSRGSPKYDPAVLDAKWATFTEGGGLTIGTIFKEAERGGWVPPWRRTATRARPAANGAANGDGAHEPGGEGRRTSQAAPTLDGYRARSLGSIVDRMGTWVPVWKDWIIAGNLSLLSARPKVGKTRAMLHGVAGPLWTGGPFPDGAENPHPAGSKVLLLPYDKNQAEVHDECLKIGIPPHKAIVVPSHPDDPDGLTLSDIDDPVQIALIRASLVNDPDIRIVVIDTLTYASRRSLCKAEEMKAMLDPLMTVAMRHGVGVLGLFHVNKEGEALGVRITERARVLMKIERLDASDPTKLRWYVAESYLPRRPAVSVTYDGDALVFGPDRPAGDDNKPEQCARWLVEYLTGRSDWTTYGRLINEAGDAGFAGTRNDKGYWSHRDTLNRAIRLVNDNKVPGLAGYGIDAEPDPGHRGKGRRPNRYRLVGGADESPRGDDPDDRPF